MQEFTFYRGKATLPEHLQRWEGTVQQMLCNLRGQHTCYLMIDQEEVKAGRTHRRPGVHFDGVWIPGLDTSYTLTENDTNKLMFLASNVEGCAAYRGTYDSRLVGEGGDCSRVPVLAMERVVLKPNTCYAMTVVTLHESIPVVENCKRTLVRINVA